MVNCIIIEDQPPAQRILEKYIADTEHLVLKKTFSDVISAEKYLKNESVNLIFLDIHLPFISGIDFLKSEQFNYKVILTTAYSDYALESYQYNVIDYLLKPFSFQRFTQAISKLMMYRSPEAILKEQTGDSVMIKSGHELIKISSSDIIYIKSDSDYTEIFTTQKTFLCNDSLRQWVEKLNDTFCQIHKSYIVNTECIQKVSGNKLFLTNEIILPIGRMYKKGFMEKFL